MKQKRICLPKMSLKEFTRYTQANPLLLSCMSTFYFPLLLLPSHETPESICEKESTQTDTASLGMRERETSQRRNQCTTIQTVSVGRNFFVCQFLSSKIRRQKEEQERRTMSEEENRQTGQLLDLYLQQSEEAGDRHDFHSPSLFTTTF